MTVDQFLDAFEGACKAGLDTLRETIKNNEDTINGHRAALAASYGRLNRVGDVRAVCPFCDTRLGNFGAAFNHATRETQLARVRDHLQHCPEAPWFNDSGTRAEADRLERQKDAAIMARDVSMLATVRVEEDRLAKIERLERERDEARVEVDRLRATLQQVADFASTPESRQRYMMHGPRMIISLVKNARAALESER